MVVNPDRTPSDRDALRQIWQLIDAHRPALEAAALRELLAIPALAQLLASADLHQVAADAQRSNEIQRRALVDAEWEPYAADLRRQAHLYASLGVSYGQWFRMLAPTRRILTPLILALDDGVRVIGALQDLLDFGMSELGDAYVAARQVLVQQAEAERDRTRHGLERSHQELESFAYVASHDLKAPLRDIHTLAGWIEEDGGDALPDPSKKHLLRLRDRAQRMEHLLDDLLAYSRVGRRADSAERFLPSDAVASAVALAGSRPGIRVEVVGTWPEIHTPRAPLELVVRNLVGNALKHHDGSVGVVRVGGTDLGGDRIELWVEDDGPGIPAAYQERVFQMFQTLRPRDDVEGSGMGLAIVRKVADTFGSDVELRSDGRGCRFRLTWPSRWAPVAGTP